MLCYPSQNSVDMQELLKNGVVKVIDFGLGKDLSDSSLTGTICGTPGYMAPEISEKGHYSYEVDVFSLGVILENMLTICRIAENSKYIKLAKDMQRDKQHRITLNEV